jgi:hypothetical protein
MAHANHDWKRRHRPAARQVGTAAGTDSSTSSATTNGLINPVAPTIIGDPFATSTTPTLSPSPVQSCVYLSVPPSVSDGSH